MKERRGKLCLQGSAYLLFCVCLHGCVCLEGAHVEDRGQYQVSSLNGSLLYYLIILINIISVHCMYVYGIIHTCWHVHEFRYYCVIHSMYGGQRMHLKVPFSSMGTLVQKAFGSLQSAVVSVSHVSQTSNTWIISFICRW